jgi:hypothetical protein
LPAASAPDPPNPLDAGGGAFGALSSIIMNSKILDPGGADVISSLPGDVLLHVLSFVPTTEEAIQTRTLSRRWRHIWLCLPALAFSDIGKTPTTPGLIELVDAALAYNHETLTIHIQRPRHKLQARA